MTQTPMAVSPPGWKASFGLIRKINEEGSTVLFVEQNVFKAMSIAHEAYVLENGRIVLSGPAAEMKNNPRVKEAYLGG